MHRSCWSVLTTGRRATFSFEQLNPLTRKAVKNDDAIAVIVGVASYANASAPAVYADADAQVFHDYAVEKLGVPPDHQDPDQ